jgi:preprotein translocase subunit SecF
MGVTEMKKMAVLLLFVAFAFAGCASGSFLGLATTGYVDEKGKTVADQQVATAAEIEQLKSQLSEVQAIKDQAQAAVDQAKTAVEQVGQIQSVIQELQALSQKAEDRIGSIPKEVIKQIVDILQAALQE